MEKKEYGGVDALRFVAAMIVSIFHLGYWCWAYPSGQSGRAAHVMGQPPAAIFGSFGWVGVEIFFVISGFVIAFSATKATPRQFAQRRFLRLAPAVWIIAPLSAAVALVSGAVDLHGAAYQLLRSITFWPYGKWTDSVYWTLGIEIVFYAVVWLLILAHRVAYLEQLGICLGIIGSAFWAGSLAHPNAALATSRELDLLLVHHGTHFALGILLWACVAKGITTRRIAWIALFAAATCIQIAARSNIEAAKVGEAGVWWAPVFVWLAAMGAMALAIRYPFGGTGWRRLGIMTFPLYLLHDVAGAACLGFAVRHGIAPAAAVAVVLIATIGACWFIAELPEQWVRITLRGLLDRLPAFDRGHAPPPASPIDFRR